jgi:hypothetical protein
LIQSIKKYGGRLSDYSFAARPSADSKKPQAVPLKNPIAKPSQNMARTLLADSHEVL